MKILQLSGLFYACTLLILQAQTLKIGHAGHGNRPNGTTVRSGTYQTLSHGDGTFTSSVTREAGETTATTTWNNQNGNGGARSFTDTYDQTGQGTAKGTDESTTNYANGKTSSSQGTWTHTAPGDSTSSGTHVGTNGNVTDVTRDTTTDNGVPTIDATYDNTATGKITTVDKTISRGANGSKQVDTTVMGPNGKKVTSDQTYTKDADGYTKAGTITLPNGEVSTDNINVGVTKDSNGEITRAAVGTITLPNGATKPVDKTETSTRTFTPASASTTTGSTID